MRQAIVKVTFAVDVQGPDDEGEWLATEDHKYSEFLADVDRVPGANVKEVDIVELPELARHYWRAKRLWSGLYFAGLRRRRFALGTPRLH